MKYPVHEHSVHQPMPEIKVFGNYDELKFSRLTISPGTWFDPTPNRIQPWPPCLSSSAFPYRFWPVWDHRETWKPI
jgi:hypothetical protein